LLAQTPLAAERLDDRAPADAWSGVDGAETAQVEGHDALRPPELGRGVASAGAR
jgi:hypothetical protein